MQEFVEAREPEPLVFATKREAMAGIYQTYLPRGSATLEKLGYRIEGPIKVDPYTELMLWRVRPSGWPES